MPNVWKHSFTCSCKCVACAHANKQGIACHAVTMCFPRKKLCTLLFATTLNQLQCSVGPEASCLLVHSDENRTASPKPHQTWLSRNTVLRRTILHEDRTGRLCDYLKCKQSNGDSSCRSSAVFPLHLRLLVRQHKHGKARGLLQRSSATQPCQSNCGLVKLDPAFLTSSKQRYEQPIPLVSALPCS